MYLVFAYCTFKSKLVSRRSQQQLTHCFRKEWKIHKLDANQPCGYSFDTVQQRPFQFALRPKARSCFQEALRERSASSDSNLSEKRSLAHLFPQPVHEGQELNRIRPYLNTSEVKIVELGKKIAGIQVSVFVIKGPAIVFREPCNLAGNDFPIVGGYPLQIR